MAKRRYRKNEMGDVNDPEVMERAKAWMKQLLDKMNEGATWGIPRSSSFYRFYHSSKTVIRISHPNKDESTEMVLKAMGWKIVKPTKES